MGGSGRARWLRPGPNAHHRLVCALRRKYYAPRIEQATRKLLETIDAELFRRRFSDNPRYAGLKGRGSSKYLDLERWIRVAVERFYAYGFTHLPRGAQILDVGCGSGYFLLAGRHLGYEMLGVDLDLDDLYNEQIAFFELKRIVHLIRPGDYLPAFRTKFDLVTGFMTGFNEDFDGRPWGAEEWAGFLPALRACLDTGKEAFFQFNWNVLAGGYCTPQACRALRSSVHFKTVFFANCVRLVAV